MEMTATFLACLFLAQLNAPVEPARLSEETDAAAAVPAIQIPPIQLQQEAPQNAPVPQEPPKADQPPQEPFKSPQFPKDAPKTDRLPQEAPKTVRAPQEPPRANQFAQEPQKADPTTPSPGKRLNPPEMVAEAMALSPQGKLVGQPITLLQALASNADRRRQLEIARAYWRLAQAVAENHFCTAHADQIAAMRANGDDAAMRMATASAAAMVRDSELEATNAQYDLAALMSMPPDAPLPLPSDRPHVGAYRTNFQELFAGRVAPERTRLMDRVLPIWRQAVDERASAVQAAEDVFLAVSEAQTASSAVVTSSEKLLQERRAFIRVVCDYNRDIAEYGLTVAASGATPQMLVTMLIDAHPEPTPSMAATQDLPAGNASGIQQTGLNEPIPVLDSQSSHRQPTLAQPKRNEPTLAPPRESLNLNRQDDSIPDAAPTAAPRTDAPEMPFKASEKPAKADQATVSAGAMVPVKVPAAASELAVPDSDLFGPPSEPKSVTAHKPAAAPGSLGAVDAASPLVSENTPLYAGLLDADPAVRTKQLTIALYWDRSSPETSGRPLTLADSLTRSINGNQQGAIELYWRVRQRAARYQTLQQQVEWLDTLTSVLLERRSAPTGPIEMLHLRAAHLAAKAALRESQISLVAAQHELAVQTGSTADALWPLPTTAPHSGKYLLKLDVQSRNVATSLPVRRLSTAIPSLGDNIQQRATAVVNADAVRSSAIAQYRNGGESIAPVLEAIDRQMSETLVFLETLTQYNLAIADYAMAVLPAGTPAERLAASLVVKP